MNYKFDCQKNMTLRQNSLRLRQNDCIALQNMKKLRLGFCLTYGSPIFTIYLLFRVFYRSNLLTIDRYYRKQQRL